jgi:tetratricopeptide (TPR) repeat protein
MRTRLCSAILTIWLSVPCAKAQVASPEHQGQQEKAVVRSGALVGMNSGQTFWIAPVDGKVHILVAQDYVIPRKNDFWRVRFDVNWNDPTPGVPLSGRLWAVPLKKGMDAVAWSAEQPVINTSEEGNKQEEGTVEAMQREAEEEGHHIGPLFLSPDCLSFYDEYTEVSSGGSTRGRESYTMLKITDAPATSGRTAEQLLVEEMHVPFSDDTRDKDLRACVRADDQLSDTDKEWALGQETTLGIRRGQQRWIYSWLMGGGAGFPCPVSIPPPRSMVGENEVFPEWKKIKSAYPAAEDAFSSPSHDLLLIVVAGKLIAVSVLKGEIGEPLAQVNLMNGPVMVQWAIGKYVDAWTKELTPYFQAYASDTARRDPKLDNGEGLTFMQRHQPGSAVGWFVGAAMGDPTNAEYPNNAGFAYYQLGKYEESVLWLEKTMSIDPNRAVAYLNLGDALVRLNRSAEAREAYTKYMGLAPNSKSAADVKKKLEALSPKGRTADQSLLDHLTEMLGVPLDTDARRSVLRMELDVTGDGKPELFLGATWTGSQNGMLWVVYTPRANGRYQPLGVLQFGYHTFYYSAKGSYVCGAVHTGSTTPGFAYYHVGADGIREISDDSFRPAGDPVAKMHAWQKQGRPPVYVDTLADLKSSGTPQWKDTDTEEVVSPVGKLDAKVTESGDCSAEKFLGDYRNAGCVPKS